LRMPITYVREKSNVLDPIVTGDGV
jgi:hypothetical protein